MSHQDTKFRSPALEVIDPSDVQDWDEMLLENGNPSFFHTAAWARVLKESYGFKPVYVTALNQRRLSLLMPMMEVSSRLTGKRGVSLPFTDHCAPFCLNPEALPSAVRFIQEKGRRSGWNRVEWRDGAYFDETAAFSETHYVHELDLTRSEPELFGHLRGNCRRNILKAAKEGLEIGFDNSEEKLESFIRLNALTRRRHGLPSQPSRFFKKVLDHVLNPGHGLIATASRSGIPVASAVFFHFGTSVIFKYGASDIAHQGFRPNNLLMWEAIRWYRQGGFSAFNLGRTSMDNPGLLQYKRAWGGEERRLKYYRYDLRKKAFISRVRSQGSLLAPVFSRSPRWALRLIGRVFYKHIG